MLNILKARVNARALLSTVPVGAVAGAALGLTLGGAYLAGAMAQDEAGRDPTAAAASDVLKYSDLDFAAPTGVPATAPAAAATAPKARKARFAFSPPAKP